MIKSGITARLILIVNIIFLSSPLWAEQITNEGQHILRHKATRIVTDTTNFNNNLSATDTDIQKALDTIDNLTITGAPTNATYLTSTSNATLTNEVDLGLLSTGLLKGTVAAGVSTLSSITDSSTNWDIAYTDRLKWDGGATGLTAATGRDSLGLRGFNSAYTSDNAVYIQVTSGNVGIGTTGPNQKLELNGGGAYTPALRFAHGTAEYFWDVGYVTSALGNYLQFYNSDGATTGTRMVIKYDGNVGIGTTGPTYLLEVNGTFQADTATLATVLGAIDAGGATSVEVPNSADLTLDTTGEIGVNSTHKGLAWYDGTQEVFQPSIHTLQGSVGTGDYDTDPDVWILDLDADTYPHGIYIKKVYVDCNEADPTTELNADLKYCDAVANGAFPGANATLIKALDTTTGNMSDAAVNTAVASAKTIYITIDADPVSDTTIFHVRVQFYIPES